MTDFLTEKGFSRRTFLKGSGALVVGFSVAGSTVAGKASAAATRGDVAGPPDPNQVDSWIAVNPDNTATIYFGKVELGQGSTTGLLQIAAEELDLTMDQVGLVRHDTNVTPDQGNTAGSNSIQNGGPQVRGAAAEARRALLGLASASLGVPVAQLSVDKGVVSGGGKSVKYGDLIGGKLFNVKVTGTAPQKAVSDYKIVTTRVPRIDIPGKVSGKYTYMHNVRVPGMLHGRVVRPHGQAAYGQGAKPLSVDESSIRNIAGAQVIRKGDFVGVVAPKEYAAIQAAAQLKVKWADNPVLPGNGNLVGAIRGTKTNDRVAVSTGNVDSGFSQATKTVQASFSNAYQVHGLMGPSCAIADVKSGNAMVLCSSQNIYGLRRNLAPTLGMDQTQIRVQFIEGAGTYGHSTYDDAAQAAAVMSQATGKPVRVQFMRWDEHGWDNYAPAQVIDLKAGIDANGKLVAYDYASWQSGYMNVETTQELVGQPVPPITGNADTSNSGSMYAIPNRRVTSKSVPTPGTNFLKTVWVRAPGAPQATFASEQVLDELAHAAGLDPLEFKRKNISNERWLGVLDAVAKAANWQSKVANSRKQTGNVVTGRGIAIGGFANTSAAVIADIEVNLKTGKIRAKHLYGAQDAGLVVNPGTVETQIEGSMMQGASRALIEELKFSKSRVTSLDWGTYPVIRFKDAPKLTPIVVQRTDQKSTGSGEPPLAPVPAAIANAFFDATGVRLREYPMTPARVRAALAAAKA
jgi:CO/xanthine dehydrogenase Mo-binding subunit